jgi:hypothetical protein
MKKSKELKKSYEDACNAYLKAFTDKHGYEYDPDLWVGGKAGTIICIGDYFVDMVTVITDIDMDAPEDEFLKWYDYCTEVGMLGGNTPNFDHWLRGCPVFSKEEINKMWNTLKKIEELKEELNEQLKEQLK